MAGTDAGGGDGDDHSSGNTARVEGATSEAEVCVHHCRTVLPGVKGGLCSHRQPPAPFDYCSVLPCYVDEWQGAARGGGVLFEVGGGEDGDSVDAEVGGVDDDADEGADDAEEGSDDDDANGDESGEPEKQVSGWSTPSSTAGFCLLLLLQFLDPWRTRWSPAVFSSRSVAACDLSCPFNPILSRRRILLALRLAAVFSCTTTAMSRKGQFNADAARPLQPHLPNHGSVTSEACFLLRAPLCLPGCLSFGAQKPTAPQAL